MKRYTWSHEKQTMDECDVGGFVLYTDAVKMQREAYVAGVVGNDIDSRPCHCKECEEILREAKAEAARRYKEE